MDYHLHSKHSFDGQMTIEEGCRRAIELGISEIIFTDHLEIEKQNCGDLYHEINLDEYIKDLEKNKDKFKDQLTLKYGIEIGLRPYALDMASKIVKQYPFDFVIGSIHHVENQDPYYKEYYKGKTKEESYKIYYNTILQLIKNFDDFDVLGHLDYIKRYSPIPYERGDELLAFHIIEGILKTLIEKDKGIEVNTSGYNHVSNSPMPSLPVIKRYRELGGQIITIGTDAHDIQSMGFGLESGLELIKEGGFSHISSFSKRKAKLNPIYL